MSAIIQVRSAGGRFLQARALLDTCATANFVTESFAHRLNLPMSTCSIPIGAVNELQTFSKHVVQIPCSSMNGQFQKSLSFLTVSRIADLVPSEVFPRELISIPSNIKLADPQFHLPRAVDILIGSGTTLSLLSIGQINLSSNNVDLILQKTQLGWVIVGGVGNESKEQSASCHLTDLSEQVSRFWVIEDAGSKSSKSHEESLCETQYQTHTTRDTNGRYIVRLPFRTENVDFGDSKSRALRRFLSLQRRLNADTHLKAEYFKVMQEYIDLGHVNHAPDDTQPGYYMPHHPVVKASSNTTKVRVVFDASAKTNKGISLNGTLLVGPTIQDKHIHLLRFRTHTYVLTADIAQMYRQVFVHPDDRRFQRILWYHNGNIRTFELNRVTFGVSSAPYSATRSIVQLANDEDSEFPVASRILKRDLYVDDLLTGADSLAEVLRMRDEIIALLRRGGFDIRQWASNHHHALDNFDERTLDLDCAIDENPVSKTLGIVWNSQGDSFVYTVYSIDPTIKVTKRNILSSSAKIFDPLGLLGPVVLAAKIIIQECWKAKVHWDESVPQELNLRWVKFAEQLNLIREFSVNRHIIIPNTINIEVHGFCDASKVGYGACLYIRSSNSQGKVLVRLACAKSRVSPTKEATIPRLELCGAQLLSRLYSETLTAFHFPISQVTMWSDSTIVLQWWKKSPQLLKVFEANRVAEIQALGDKVRWRRVRTRDNPADALSRGQLPSDFLSNQLWFNGPPWLSRAADRWPASTAVVSSDLPGLRKNVCLLSNQTELFQRFSSYSTLINSIAYCLRMLRSNGFKGRGLSVVERSSAEQKILSIIQNEQYNYEVEHIKETGEAKSLRLRGLNPFIDQEGILRVGGRLKHAPISFTTKHPILLPSNHHVTNLIIRETHKNTHHTGIQTTLYTIRHRFWLLDGKNQVRKIVRRCVECIRHRPNVLHSKMADLPSARVNESAAFSHVGVDYFGPLYITEKRFRNKARIKVYGCVFICMATKAVHIEIVSDLTTDGFLGAFGRFIGRRGIPSHVYSDNGTNFVGANNELRELYCLLESEQHQDLINDYAARKNISWHFNPPLSPHFGGIWETAVKSFKHHFKRVVKDQLLTFEELNSLGIQIESILNSRPLCS